MSKAPACGRFFNFKTDESIPVEVEPRLGLLGITSSRFDLDRTCILCRYDNETYRKLQASI
jgi:hypothetical protein